MYIDGFRGHQCLSIATTSCLGNNRNLTFSVHFSDFQELKGASSFVTLDW